MSVHIVRGKDAALVSEAVGRLVTSLLGDADRALSVEDFDGDEYALTQVVDAIQTPPFLTDRRVIVVRRLDRFTVDELMPFVSALADRLDTSRIVATWTEGAMPKRALDGLRTAGAVIHDTEVGTAEKARREWLDEQLSTSGLHLDPPARAAVLSQVGEDLGRIGALLEVLISTYGPGARLGREDVEPFLGEAGGVPPWELTDAIDRGDTATALERLTRLLGAGRRHPLQVMAVLQNHYGRLLRLDRPDLTDDRAAAEVLGMKPGFAATKAFNQARRLGSERLARAAILLADADLDLRGRIDWPPELVLEVLVARLSRLAPAAGRRR